MSVYHPSESAARVSAPPPLVEYGGGLTWRPADGSTVAIGARAFAVAVDRACEVIVSAAEFFPEYPAPPTRVTRQAQTALLSQYYGQFAERLAAPGRYLGVYHDVESGRVYLDTSTVVWTLAQAIAIGVREAQESVFAFETAQCLYLDTERGREAAARCGALPIGAL